MLNGNMSGERPRTLRGKLWGLCILLPLISPLSCFANFSPAKELVYRIKEGLPSGAMIGSVGADLRLDFSVDPPLSFNLNSKRAGQEQYVSLNGTTGELRTSARAIDRETLCRGEADGQDCSLHFDVFVLPQRHFRLLKVKVVVEDVNDNEPRFPALAGGMRLLVPEDSAVGVRFALEQSATDPDAGSNGVQTYWLSDDFGLFTLDVEENEGGELTPVLIVTGPLDRETRAEYETVVVAEDGGVPPLLGTVALTIVVTDVNDNCPRFPEETRADVTVYGNATKGTQVARVHAHDPDLGTNGRITYAYSERVGRDARSLFALDRVTGVIRLAGEIDDGAATKLYRLTVLAIGPGCVPAVAMVSARVVPVGPGPAAAIAARYISTERDGAVWLRESEPSGSPVAFFTVKNVARGGGSGGGGVGGHKVECRLEGEGPFRLTRYGTSADEYLLETSGALDYERRREYELAVVAVGRNGHGRPLARTSVRIRVTDENDNAPIFERGPSLELSLEENNAPGAFLATLHATDEDSGSRGEVIYLLGSDAPPSLFSLDRATGVLTASTSLDREEKERHRFTVRALDRGSPRKEAVATVTVTVLDRNDNAPRFVGKDFTFFVPEENFAGSGFETIGALSATDADAGPNGRVALSIINGSEGVFAIDAAGGEEGFLLRARAPLDREQRGAYVLWVEAVDGGSPPLSCVAAVTVLLVDVNDNAPLVLSPRSNRSYALVPPDTRPGTAVAEVYAVDRDAGMNAVIAYSIVRRRRRRARKEEGSDGGGGGTGCFEIDPDTGNITLRRWPLDRGLHSLLVRVSDRGQPEPLHATVLVNLFVNETVGNESYVRGLLGEEAAAMEAVEAPAFDRVVDLESGGAGAGWGTRPGRSPVASCWSRWPSPAWGCCCSSLC
ncbi:hypothetical protein AAFF_G00159040 [Aldrovandia affinis]|uniref:Cadherin domain-containing protein n=1 Tax=Aldrovandia affinis TaxID=143900 RepID=A0AAD7W7P1_9TELE|nr:hypothetical protein AAFF_G00159040 [Aldrovandia affinis]